MGGHEWVLLFYPDGKRSLNDNPPAPPNDDPYAALFVALIGEGPRPQGVVTSSQGRVVRAFHRFTLVDQSRQNRDITKGRQRDQGAVKISCARQDPNARNCHGYRKFVRRSVLEGPNNGYLVDDTIVIRYEIELVVTSGGALNRINKPNPHTIDVSSCPTLGDQMATLLTDADGIFKPDCEFEVEGERFPAHSLIMSARSSYFRAMLGDTGAGMREGSDGVIRLHDIEAPVFKLLMHFMYTDSLPERSGTEVRGAGGGDGRSGGMPGHGSAAGRMLLGRGPLGAGTMMGGTNVSHGGSRGAEGTGGGLGGGAEHGGGGDDGAELDVAMTQHLLVAADRFDLSRLRAICESRLCNMVDVDTAATTLTLAEQNNAQALKQACLEYVASHLAEVMGTEGYRHMEQSCPQLASELLRTVALHNREHAQASNQQHQQQLLVAAAGGVAVAGGGRGEGGVGIAGAGTAAGGGIFGGEAAGHTNTLAPGVNGDAAADVVGIHQFNIGQVGGGMGFIGAGGGGGDVNIGGVGGAPGTIEAGGSGWAVAGSYSGGAGGPLDAMAAEQPPSGEAGRGVAGSASGSIGYQAPQHSPHGQGGPRQRQAGGDAVTAAAELHQALHPGLIRAPRPVTAMPPPPPREHGEHGASEDGVASDASPGVGAGARAGASRAGEATLQDGSHASGRRQRRRTHGPGGN